MALPSDATIPRQDDSINVLLYKLARALEEAAGTATSERSTPRNDDPKNIQFFKGVLALRAFITYLENLNLGNVVINEVVGKYRFKEDGSFQLWNDDQMGYQTLTIGGVAGEEYINIGDVEA